MNQSERRLERAIRMTPAHERKRYAEEWRGDMAAARDNGQDPGDVAHAAVKVGRNLRLQQIGRVLAGASGVGAMLAAWSAVAVLTGVLAQFGWLGVLVAGLVWVVIVLALSRSGSPTHWSHWLMVVSLVVGAGLASFVWWVMGAKLDAADSMTPEPAATSYGGAALVGLAICFVVFIFCGVYAILRQARRINRDA